MRFAPFGGGIRLLGDHNPAIVQFLHQHSFHGVRMDIALNVQNDLFHHLSLSFRIKTIAKIPPPITTAAITATIHHGKENLSLSTGEVCSVLFSLFSFRSVLLSLSGSTLLFSSLSLSRLPLYFTGSVIVALQTRQL